MNTNIEEIAQDIAEQRWGVGAWHTPGKVNRSYWRRQAKKLLEDLGKTFQEDLHENVSDRR